jgi:hypothetical protein
MNFKLHSSESGSESPRTACLLTQRAPSAPLCMRVAYTSVPLGRVTAAEARGGAGGSTHARAAEISLLIASGDGSCIGRVRRSGARGVESRGGAADSTCTGRLERLILLPLEEI